MKAMSVFNSTPAWSASQLGATVRLDGRSVVGRLLTVTPKIEQQARYLEELFNALDTSTGAESLAARAAAAVVEAIGDWCIIWLFDRQTGEIRLAGLHDHDPVKVPALQKLAEGWLKPLNYRNPDGLLHLRQPLALVTESDEEARKVLKSKERVRQARQIGLKALLFVPLAHRGSRLGLLVIGSAEPGSVFTDSDVDFATHAARYLSGAIAQLQRLGIAHQVSQQLTLTSLRLQTILRSVPQGIIVADAPDGRVMSTSDSLIQLLGRSIDPDLPAAEYPEGLGLATPKGELYRPERVPWVLSARTAEPVGPEEMVIGRPDGTQVTVLCSASPIADEEGTTVGAVAVLQDITERKEFERRKDEFLAVASHELKTPITVIKGYVQLLERRMRKEPGLPLGKTEVHMLEAVGRQVGQLTALVGSILDFAVIQTGRLVLHRTKFDLAVLAREVVEEMRVAEPERILRITFRGDTTVDADPDRIRQVLNNLISNAVKATKPGGRIEVRVRRLRNSVVASVHDDGVGIPDEAKQRIFERLYRAPGTYYAGLGLGLATSKAIIDQHGGRIWFKSEHGKGSTFSFELALVSP